ncbi:SubName: Full=Uncharacterized protein {ECO:0000313/EMBL:CCA72479.1} [Serendipita indica DSM 11827]|nr:SubName: Full=Uncharacterized protein {ECO:0000313/EMBL:CCA72479.1} [Serendipita indica DSM 11827]
MAHLNQAFHDVDDDDNDDIVGSYLQDSHSFLNAWSQSMNAPQGSVNDNSKDSQAWTSPHATTRLGLGQQTSMHRASPDTSQPTTSRSRSNSRTAVMASQQPTTTTTTNTSTAGTGTGPTPLTRTVRKSSSNRKLQPKTSLSNLVNAANATVSAGGGNAPAPGSGAASLPDPSLFPDPYPSGFSAANASTTPPVSLFSAGSSSARSSAYTSASPASALRSSVASSDSAHNARHAQQYYSHHSHMSPQSSSRLSAGDAILPHPLNHSHLLDHHHAISSSSEQTALIHPFGLLNTSDMLSPSQVGVASTADEIVQLRDMDQQLSSAVTARPGFSSVPGSRPATDYLAHHSADPRTRWSSSSAASEASKSSSWGNDPSLRQSVAGPSGGGGNQRYDWNHHVDQREHEYPTDDEEGDADGHEEDDMDRTAAVVLAEQGHGEIVHGEGKDLFELNVPSNTTHLLLGGCATPNQLPGFLVNILPSISQSLLALDISANFLSSLPPALALCRSLEELNVGHNPLRALPTWLAVLTNLRVLIADGIGISTLPPSLSAAVQLHTLSMRNNRMHSLPSWLCLLPHLEALYVEGNPFQGPWKALVEGLIPRPVAGPITPSVKSLFYAPNTPHTANSIGSTDVSEYHEEELTAQPRPTQANANPWTKGHRSTSSRDLNVPVFPSGSANAAGARSRAVTLGDKDDARPATATRARPQMHDPHSPRPHTSFGTHDMAGARTLSRTKTAPSRRPSASNSISSLLQQTPPPMGDDRLHPETNGGGGRSPAGSFNLGRANSAVRSTEALALQTERSSGPVDAEAEALERGMSPNTMRRMKSTGDMRTGVNAASPANRSEQSISGEFGDSNSSGLGKFMSVGARGPMKEEYRALTATMFETPSTSYTPQATIRAAKEREKEKDKDRNKWGFLKKMSKTRLRSGSVANEDDAKASGVGPPTHTIGPPRTMGGMGGPSETLPLMPHSSAGNTTPGAPSAPFMTASQVGFRSSTSLNQTSPPRRFIRPSLVHSSSWVRLQLPSRVVGPRRRRVLAPPPVSPINPKKTKRRSFLPIGGPAPISIPPTHNGSIVLASSDPTQESFGLESPGYPASPLSLTVESEEKQREQHQRALKSVMGYLRDMCDLSAGTSSGAAAVAAAAAAAQAQVNSNPNFAQQHSESTPGSRGPGSRSVSRRPTLSSTDAARTLSEFSNAASSTAFSGSSSPPMAQSGGSSSNPSSMFISGGMPSFGQYADMSSGSALSPDGPMESDAATIVDSMQMQPQTEEKKVKDDKVKRAMIVKEIVSTERTYVKLLNELVDIYVTPAAAPVLGITNVASKETVVPLVERKIVFNGLDSLLAFHRENFLPALEQACQTLDNSDDADGSASAKAAIDVAKVFVSHAAFMRMYSTYINNFDNALRRTKQWTDKNIGAALVGSAAPSAHIGGNAAAKETVSQINLTPAQRKRIKQYLKRCRAHPRHSQMNMESYLLLPVQRIPRYRLLFEELVRATPPNSELSESMLQKALDEITVLASNMNEGKREAESRRKLVHWQGRIRGKFPSPLVQPHLRKIASYFEVVGAQGEKTLVSVECLAPEVTPRSLTAILCNDLLVLCKDPSGGKDPNGPVDLWAVLRMQTVSTPASIVHNSALRLVDNKAILYFDLPSQVDAMTWSRAINMHIPTSTK